MTEAVAVAPTPRRSSSGCSRSTRVARVVTTTILLLVMQHQVPTGMTGGDGRPRHVLPVHRAVGRPVVPDHRDRTAIRTSSRASEGGGVQQNAWAFYPALPVRWRGRHGGDRPRASPTVGSMIALLCGFGAAVLMGLLLRERIGDPAALPRRRAVGELPRVGDAAARLHRVARDAAARRLPLRPGPGALARRDWRRAARRARAPDRRAARGSSRSSCVVAALARTRRPAHRRDASMPPWLASLVGVRCRRAPLARDRVVAHRGRAVGLHRHDGGVARLRDGRAVHALAGNVQVRVRRHVGAGLARRRPPRHRRDGGRAVGQADLGPTCARGRWPTRPTSPRCSTPSRASSATSSRSSRSSSSWSAPAGPTAGATRGRGCSSGPCRSSCSSSSASTTGPTSSGASSRHRPATTRPDDRRPRPRRANFAGAKLGAVAGQRSREREGWDRACARSQLSGIQPKKRAVEGGSAAGEGGLLLGQEGVDRDLVVRAPTGQGHQLRFVGQRVREIGARADGDGATDRPVGERRTGRQGRRELGDGAVELVSGTTFVTRPSASASSAGMVRGNMSSSLARAGPTSRGSDHEAPESQERAMPAKAVLSPAPSTMTRNRRRERS